MCRIAETLRSTLDYGYPSQLVKSVSAVQFNNSVQ